MKKAGLRLNIQKVKVTVFSPITSWKIDGGEMEKVEGFVLGDSKITADGDYSHEIKRCLLLGRKVITKVRAGVSCIAGGFFMSRVSREAQQYWSG